MAGARIIATSCIYMLLISKPLLDKFLLCSSG